MKILHVILELQEINGGPPRGLSSLARSQAARGDDVAVVPCRRTHGPQTLYPGTEGNLTCHEAVTDSKLLWYNRALSRTLYELARDRDIVHIHGTWRYHVVAAASAAKGHGIPYVVRPAGNLGLVTRGHKTLRKRLYFGLIERRILNGAAGIHCCSLKEAQELATLALHSRSFIIPQPVDFELRHIEPDYPGLMKQCPQLGEERKIVLYLGRICSIKNLEVLLEAFIRVQSDFGNWQLVLAGPHEERDLVASLRTRIEQAKKTDVVLLPGIVRGGTKAALFSMASIFAQPSRHENFGMSVAEALMFGLPCVVSEGVALGNEIEDAKAGFSVASEVGSFELALRRLMENQELRREYALGAAELAKRYDPQVVAEGLNSEYQACLNSRKN